MIYDAEKQRPRGKGRSRLSLSRPPSDGKLSHPQTQSVLVQGLASGQDDSVAKPKRRRPARCLPPQVRRESSVFLARPFEVFTTRRDFPRGPVFSVSSVWFFTR